MKILVINWQDIKNPNGGGAEVHAHEIFKRIVAQGHDVTFFSCEVDGLPNNEVIDGINIIRSGGRNTFNFTVPSYYTKHFKDINFDIIIDDINKIPFYTPLYIKKPIVAISHHFFGYSIFRETNFIFGLYVYISEFLVNFVYKKVNFAVVSDSTLSEFINRGFDRSKFSLVYNAFDKEHFPMKVSQKAEFPVITYFGRLKKYKSVDHLFHSFAALSEKFPTAKLEIIGRGDFRPFLETLSEKLHIKDKVLFHGFVDDSKKIELLSRSWVVVNTSMKEGWGITNIEANACGTPVISANVPGLRDSVKEGVSGLLYRYADIKDLESKVEQIISNNSYMINLSKTSIDWADNFSWEKSTSVMIELLKKSIKEKLNK
ncbi:MAG TPA: glycosyltransferase family 4 protein [Candidatus Kapabacteria bacterium]|nr:glycosyltransferase family 4 protein [Candidatus Kapabacteria bacterium]